MDALWIKLLIGASSGLVVITFGWLRHMQTKIAEIVPRKEITDMITLQLRPGEVRTKLIKEKLDRIEEQLDILMELLVDAQQRSKRNRKTN